MLYILDADTIVQRPEILAHAAAGDLLIPQAAVDEIRGREERGLRPDLKNLLDRAIAAGAVVAPPSDGGTAELAIMLAEENGAANVRVVTSDRRLGRLLATKGVTTVSGSGLAAELSSDRLDAGLEQAARRIVSMQRLNLLIGLGIALAATAVGILVVLNHQLIFHTAPA